MHLKQRKKEGDVIDKKESHLKTKQRKFIQLITGSAGFYNSPELISRHLSWAGIRQTASYNRVTMPI